MLKRKKKKEKTCPCMINLELSITCKTIDIMHGAMWNLRGNLQIQRGFFGFVENVTSPFI
jgi:hypothetical protein